VHELTGEAECDGRACRELLDNLLDLARAMPTRRGSRNVVALSGEPARDERHPERGRLRRDDMIARQCECAKPMRAA
jgi:hypothetical protein